MKLVREFNQEQRAALVEASSLAKDGKKSQAVALLLKQGGTLALAAAQVLLAQVRIINKQFLGINHLGASYLNIY